LPRRLEARTFLRLVLMGIALPRLPLATAQEASSRTQRRVSRAAGAGPEDDFPSHALAPEKGPLHLSLEVKDARLLPTERRIESSDRLDDDQRLFGASHIMYGPTDLFAWQNLVNPTLAVSLRSSSALRAVFYRLYWLASSRDAWLRAGLSDPTGESGTFIGSRLRRLAPVSLDRVRPDRGPIRRAHWGKFCRSHRWRRGARGFYASVVLDTEGD
jgi:hypothetical protein